MKLRTALPCAIFAALLCICAPLSIPIGPVPISLYLFGVLLCAVVLNWKQSFLSVLLFLLLSLCGLPVFSGGHSGLTALPGPTGGYIWSCLLVAPAVSLLCQNTPLKKLPIPGAMLACLAGIPICYFCGTAQFSLLAQQSLQASLATCVVPFLLPDLGKALAAALLGVAVRKLLARAASD